MGDVIVDVILPNAITTDVTSPSFPGNANVFIPGADGPQGPQGPEGPLNQFKTIKVDGQSDLVPTGIESLKFIGQTGINILTDDSQNPKSIKKLNEFEKEKLSFFIAWIVGLRPPWLCSASIVSEVFKLLTNFIWT